jgi:hypothetical protein
VAEGASKGLLHRLGEKLTDKAIDRIIDLAVYLGVGAIALAWLKKEWACIQRPTCPVPGWWHGALIVATFVATVAAIWFGRAWYRARRDLRAFEATAEAKPPPFRDIEVLDNKLNLRWFIRRRPSLWLHWRNIRRTTSPSAVHEVLDGPFHAAPGCNAPLKEIEQTGLMAEVSPQSPYFDDQCSHCGRQIFRTGGPLELKVAVWQARAQALEELQRMQLNGTKLPEAQWREPVVLENPQYWKLMLPPD